MCFLILSTCWCKCPSLKLTLLNAEVLNSSKASSCAGSWLWCHGLHVFLVFSGPLFLGSHRGNVSRREQRFTSQWPYFISKARKLHKSLARIHLRLSEEQIACPSLAPFKEADHLRAIAKSTEHWSMVSAQIFFLLSRIKSSQRDGGYYD